MSIEEIRSLDPHIPLGARRENPFVFRTFFEMGQEESASPFLNAEAKRLARNLSLKASIFAAFLLVVSFFMSYTMYAPFAQVLLIGVYLIVGSISLIDSIEDIVFKKDINIDVLMTLAAFSAYFLDAGFEGALLLVLFATSGALEDAVTLKAKNALTSIHSLAPTKAYVLDQDEYPKERAVIDVEVGSIIFVRAGEIVPLDGVVVSGSSSVSLAHLTGESNPIRKRVGDEVPSGARVIEGSLTLKVLRTSSDSTISRIIELVTKAQEAKPKLERWFDKFGRIYAMLIIALSIFFTLFFAHVLDLSYFGNSGAIIRSLSFLITASPCALILAVPIAYLSALGSAAKKGIILKGGVVFDALNSVQLVAFDKTGTLTLGELIFDSIDGLSEKTEFDKVLSIGASLERNAVHPIAKAIFKEAEKRQIPLFPVTSVEVVPGFGVEGELEIDGEKVKAFVGDVKALMTRLHTDEAYRLTRLAQEKHAQGQVVACMIVKKKGYLFCFQDRPRPYVKRMLEHLKSTGRKCMMLTGDHHETAEQIAEMVGISEFHANLSPEDKLKKIQSLSTEYGLAMVGDGINDAPALARASVGICMGKVGSGTAQVAADVILLHDNIELLDWLFEKANKTKVIVRENLAIAITVIIVASVASLFGIVPLWLAVICHEGGTVLVGLNAIRLLSD